MSDPNLERLFDVLGNNHCRSYADISRHTGWSTQKVAYLLNKQRRLADSDHPDGWWTIPHTTRGYGEGLLTVVSTDVAAVLPEAIQRQIRDGLLSTVRSLATQSGYEATALAMEKSMIPQAQKRQIASFLRVLTGVSEMAKSLQGTLEEVVEKESI